MTYFNIPRRYGRARSAASIAALVIIGAGLGACSKDTSANDAAASATPRASVVQQAAAPANAADAQQTGQTPPPLDYGYLGPPSANDGSDIDPKIASRSAEKNLALFRRYEFHPPQGTEDHPLEYATLREIADAQRARFYAAATGVPQLITAQDWKWVRGEEATLISDECDDQESGTGPGQDDPKVPKNVCDAAHAANGEPS